MQLPDDIEQRLIDGLVDRATNDLAHRRKIKFGEAAELIRGWLADRQQAIQGPTPLFGRRKTDRQI